MEYKRFCGFFPLPISAYYEYICEIEHNDTERKPRGKIHFLHKAGCISPTDIVPTGILSTDTSLKLKQKKILPPDTQTDFSPAGKVFRRQLLACI